MAKEIPSKTLNTLRSLHDLYAHPATGVAEAENALGHTRKILAKNGWSFDGLYAGLLKGQDGGASGSSEDAIARKFAEMVAANALEESSQAKAEARQAKLEREQARYDLNRERERRERAEQEIERARRETILARRQSQQAMRALAEAKRRASRKISQVVAEAEQAIAQAKQKQEETTTDRREMVNQWLDDPEHAALSDREIGRRVGCSPRTVANIRRRRASGGAQVARGGVAWPQDQSGQGAFPLYMSVT